MSRFIYKMLLLICLTGIGVQGYSQDTNASALPAVWDLAACLQYAKDNNIQLRSLKLDQQSAAQNQLLAKAAVLPDLYGSASQSFNHYNRNTNGSTSALNSSGSYGLSSAWTLYQGGYI